MQSTSSVAQGSFLFLPDGFSLSKLKKSRKRKLKMSSGSKWEKGFSKIWDAVHKGVKEINEQLFSKVLMELIEHLKKLHSDGKVNEEVIPCEILLTGTNLPDHKLLLSTFIHDINQQITPYVASLWSWNCGNIKSTVQNFVSLIIPISKYRKKDADDEESDEMDIDEYNSFDNGTVENMNNSQLSGTDIYLQRSQYNLSTLASWYNIRCKENGKRKPVIIIINDFESFLPAVLGEFILLLSAYSSRIPFVLVFGVATTPVAVYQNLPRKVLSQLYIQLFKSEPSTSLLNNIIENVLFSERCPFRLGSKCMTFLTDIFLFHSFSVNSFIQGFKYCLMEHFYKQNYVILCCKIDHVEEAAGLLSGLDIESIRKVASFQRYVEVSSKIERKSLLLDDDFTRMTAVKMIKDLLEHSRGFHIALNILHILTFDLPKSPLGRTVREYYCKSISSYIVESEEYKECMKLFDLLSQNEVLLKIDSLISYLSSIISKECDTDRNKKFSDLLQKLNDFKDSLGNMAKKAPENEKEADQDEINNTVTFEVLRKTFREFIESEIVKDMLRTPTNLPLHEIIYFDDLPSVRRRISGSPRGAIHLALNNPQCYLNCGCCVSSSSEVILPTLPDISIAYKIHLECNKMINMYDWLQSFAAVIKPDSSEAKGDVDAEVQARFTRAVSELQFLGFIKASHAKTDHVSRLTWGNS